MLKLIKKEEMKNRIFGFLKYFPDTDKFVKEFEENFPENPKDEYKLARNIVRKVYIHLGETNTGKTYTAMERLKEASLIAMPTNPKNKDVYAVGDEAKMIKDRLPQNVIVYSPIVNSTIQ
mgnify:CR=1 FL=1